MSPRRAARALLRGGVLGALLGTIASPALAQSKRYPPDPVDQDRERAERSQLWEAALHPSRAPHAKLVLEAEQALRERTQAGAREAKRRLDEAVRLVPNDAAAYLLRGDAHFFLRDWAGCAADLGRARELGGGDEPRQLAELRRKLGLCQVRAGKLADGERTLAEAAVSGHATAEIWMRLGEARIAMGKLEEAIAALESAAEQPEPPVALIRWLLAGAYDRARRPAEAADALRRALELDRSFATLRNEQLPLLGTAEAEYLQGLAHAAATPPRPDYALVYLRYFLAAAPASPWRRRAEEHLRALRGAVLPEVVDRRGGNAEVDLPAIHGAVRRAMPAMRACVAATPFVIYEVLITRAGPRLRAPTAVALRGLPRSAAPPDSVVVTPVVGLPSTGDVPQAQRDAAVRCIEPLATRTPLPAVKEEEAFYRIAFHVVAPVDGSAAGRPSPAPAAGAAPPARGRPGPPGAPDPLGPR